MPRPKENAIIGKGKGKTMVLIWLDNVLVAKQFCLFYGEVG